MATGTDVETVKYSERDQEAAVDLKAFSHGQKVLASSSVILGSKAASAP